MALTPDNYLYLVDIETERVLAVFPIDHLSRELEVISLESQLRVEHRVDEPESGLALRDSRVRPLSGEFYSGSNQHKAVPAAVPASKLAFK